MLTTAGVGRPPEDARAIQQLLAKGSLSFLVLETDDVDATYERIRATGAEVLQVSRRRESLEDLFVREAQAPDRAAPAAPLERAL